MTVDNNVNPPATGMHHIAVQTHDLQASILLYRDVLGMSVVNQWGTPERQMALIDSGNGAHIELVAPVGALPVALSEPPTPPLLHFALTTTDIRQAVERVRKAGYGITIEPKDVLLGQVRATVALFNGPNGERIEFFQTN
jgi:catechol 2,3-dioxygenase-like lactoylglutathione lyase family enzyme